MDCGGRCDGARVGSGAARQLRPVLRALVLALALGWLVVGCAGRGGGAGGAVGSSPGSDTPLIGLQRGGHWSVLTIRPPHLSGPLFHLMLKNSVLTGAISGGSAPGGVLRV